MLGFEASEPLVSIRNLSYSYPGPNGPVSVLRNIEFSVRRGEFVSILGPSGGGKSTLLNVLGGLEKPGEGDVRVDNLDLAALTLRQTEAFRQTKVAFVFQFFNLLPTLSALENVLLGMEAMDQMPTDAVERAKHMLASVGLASKMGRFPAQLSGGEQQRVAIARALAKRAPLILADEPTGNLDEETAAQVMDQFATVQRGSGASLVLITHDLSIAKRADRVLELAKGRLWEATGREEVSYAAD